jgi:hypothetical protein
MAQQTAVTQNDIDAAADDFILYLKEKEKQCKTKLNASSTSNTSNLTDREQKLAKGLATYALLGERGRDWGPLISDESFTINSYSLRGRDLIGRLWIFASSLKDKEDQASAKDGMVNELLSCYNDYNYRVCNPGKMGRLCSSVLQGRLEGVKIEDHDKPLNLNQVVYGFLSRMRNERFRDLLSHLPDSLKITLI